MLINLSITLPDEVSAKEFAAYLLEQAENAAGQLEQGIIALPEIDESICIDFDEERDANLFRSE